MKGLQEREYRSGEFVRLFVHLFVHLSVDLFDCLFVHLFVLLFVRFSPLTFLRSPTSVNR